MGKQDGSSRLVTAAPPADDGSATILHVDMDAFFASVELLDRPDLHGRPVIVGHPSARSVVTAATYEARRFGVHSAMPMTVALRRCPQAVVLEPHFERYRHYSGQVMGILQEFTPLVQQLSIDEAFLDIAGARTLFGGAFELGTAIRARVRERTGLSCSVGAAATKFVAKLASTRSKPDGLLIVPEADTLDFLHPQPISALWGVGDRTAESLARLGLRSIGDVALTPLGTLRAAIGEAAAARLHELAWGRDPRPVETTREEKSVGHEVTFEHDLADPDEIRRELLRLSTQVAQRLRRAGVQARTVVLKLRYADFTTITRSRTLREPTDLGRRIYEEVRQAYEALGRPGARIRLVGVRAEQLVDGAAADVGLWDDDHGWREAEQAVDAVIERFGGGALRPAALLRREQPERPGH